MASDFTGHSKILPVFLPSYEGQQCYIAKMIVSNVKWILTKYVLLFYKYLLYFGIWVSFSHFLSYKCSHCCLIYIYVHWHFPLILCVKVLHMCNGMDIICRHINFKQLTLIFKFTLKWFLRCQWYLQDHLAKWLYHFCL